MEENQNLLNFKITSTSLLKYALPTILSSIFMNVYSIVDQLFVSNILGTDALSAVSIASPFLAIALALGTMIATVGSALVSKEMGEGKDNLARQNFSFFTLFCVVVSTIFCILGLIFRKPILHFMGADEALFVLCESYAVPIFLLIPFAMLSIIFEIFFVSAGKPGLGFGLSIAGGIANIVLDYLFLAVIPLGVKGAAYATAIGYILQSIIGTVFFFMNRKGSLYFVAPSFNGKALAQSCYNGMSEMIGMLAITITMIAMNIILMRLVGSDGVASATIILSASTILSSIYAGYIQGIGPVISYHYGAQNYSELEALYRIALKTILIMSIITFISSFPLARPIAMLFADGSVTVLNMAVRGTYIFAIGFLFMGFNYFASGFFTALNDGKTSAIISLFRTLVFLIIPLVIFPYFWGVDGVWISLPFAELLSIILSIYYLKKYKNKYHY